MYCSCLAKTLCHVPVPVTVGFYAPFGCRLHLMLDKITGEDLCAARVQERALGPCPAPLPHPHSPGRCHSFL